MAIRTVKIKFHGSPDHLSAPSGITCIRFNHSEPVFNSDLCHIVEDTIKYVGCVVERYVDRNVRIMSDVWTSFECAVVWDPAKQTYRTFRVNDLDAPYNSVSHIEVDASEERMAHYALYREGQIFGQKMREAELRYNREQNDIIQEKRTVRKGKRVKVVKGRKCPVGTAGLVFWLQSSQWGDRVGIATSERRDATGRYTDVEWTYAHNCQVI